MNRIKSFTALDFETMTAERSSACAIGIVKVVDGHIINRFYSLIKPIPDNRSTDNSAVHGITRDMVAAAPDFRELWPLIRRFVGNDMIVCHNADFDRSVWDAQLITYGLADPSQYDFFCTYRMTGLSLEECCAKHCIDMGTHHDALDDALACAKVMLAENGIIQVSTFKGYGYTGVEFAEKRKYNRATLNPLDDSQVENKSTPFFHARTVITGVFEAFPNRDELGRRLQALGADINTTISRKTDIVVIGSYAGPAKLRKIEDLRERGCDIRIIYEPELKSIIL